MNEISKKRKVAVGLFVILGLIFLLSGILMIGNLHETFKQKMKVVSLFDDVSGLQAGNNIWFSGVKIGTVSSLHFYGKSQVQVVLKIETKVQQYIRKNALVKISTDGLIGNKILVIYGGTANAAEIEEGDTLAVEKTFSSDDMINTLQDNNKNLLSITNDFKIISKTIANGEGTVGILLSDKSVYEHMNAASISLEGATAKAQQLIASLQTFSTGLNKKGTLANQLTTDTLVFNSLKKSVFKIQQMADSAVLVVSNLKKASNNPKSSLGVLLYDEESGAHLKETLKNLESSTQKLDADLEAAQHNVLLRGFFKNKAKMNEK
jgi:phospholipid/cholesterol/gamma-HCH transport system substrate-binding protein